MLVMGLVLGPSLKVISITGILLYTEVSPIYNIMGVHCCCLHVNCIVYKYLNT